MPQNGAPMESHAATVLTPYAFSKLQEELVLAAHYASYQLDDGCFHVRHHTKLEGGRKVIWVPQEGMRSCSSHQFEFSSIQYRHTLRVLSTIPEPYLPIRWCRVNAPSYESLQIISSDHAERVQALQSMVSALINESAKSKERLDIATKQISMLLYGIKEQPVSTHGLRDLHSIRLIN